MRIAVIGAGITGMFTAYYLLREGVDVILVDPEEPGLLSGAAAGILEYKRPSITRINVRDYPSSYLDALSIGSTRIEHLDPFWIRIYLKVYGRDPPAGIWNAIDFMAEFSSSEFRRLSEERDDFGYSEGPFYETGVDVEEEVKRLREEPLQPRFSVGECCGKPAIVQGDVARLSTEMFIARIRREIARATFVKARAGAIGKKRVEMREGKDIEVDSVVAATGWWARRLGVPVAPFKGYGFLTTARSRVAFVDISIGVAVVPSSIGTKVTGRFDLDGSRGMSKVPASWVLSRANDLLGKFDVMSRSYGYRPCTPDGLPVLERRKDITVVTGGCRMGWTYAPALGKLAADLALGRSVPHVLSSIRLTSIDAR